MDTETPVKVKVCGIRSMAQADLALSLGADFIGLNLYNPSPRSIDRKTAFDLCQRIPAGKRVMVDVNTATDELEDIADLGFDFFQIHFDLDVDWGTIAAWCGIVGQERLWLAPKIPPGYDFAPPLLEFADTFVIDGYKKGEYGGTGKVADWGHFNTLATMYQHKQWVLAGGLSPENISEAKPMACPNVVDVNSGVEIEPGVKDPAKLKAFFAALYPA